MQIYRTSVWSAVQQHSVCNTYAVSVQFEDPTDALQSLRDLVDLQRAMDCGWLQSAAEQVCWQTLCCMCPHCICVMYTYTVLAFSSLLQECLKWVLTMCE